MNPFRKVFNSLQKYYAFRNWYARCYPVFQRTGLLGTMKSFEAEGAGEPWLDSLNAAMKFNDPGSYTFNLKELVPVPAALKLAFLVDRESGELATIREVCRQLEVDCVLYEVRDPDLFRKLKDFDSSGLIVRVDHANHLMRQIFSEVLEVLSTDNRIRIYPTLGELHIYEAKRSLINYMVYKDIPHPETRIFYDYRQAMEYVETCEFPKVFKTHIGASSSGVEILRDKKSAIRLTKRLFRKYYLKRGESDFRSMDWGYIMFQDFIPDVQEFRVIKIGDSWWGWEKWKEDHQDFMSGSGTFKWTPPSLELLDFCDEIAREQGFGAMSFDIFLDGEGNFLVNELQTRFGSYEPTEMFVDGVPGRYIRTADGWVFEEGYFNVNRSMFMIIRDFIDFIEGGDEDRSA